MKLKVLIVYSAKTWQSRNSPAIHRAFFSPTFTVCTFGVNDWSESCSSFSRPEFTHQTFPDVSVGWIKDAFMKILQVQRDQDCVNDKIYNIWAFNQNRDPEVVLSFTWVLLRICYSVYFHTNGSRFPWSWAGAAAARLRFRCRSGSWCLRSRIRLVSEHSCRRKTNQGCCLFSAQITLKVLTPTPEIPLLEKRLNEVYVTSEIILCWNSWRGLFTLWSWKVQNQLKLQRFRIFLFIPAASETGLDFNFIRLLGNGPEETFSQVTNNISRGRELYEWQQLQWLCFQLWQVSPCEDGETINVSEHSEQLGSQSIVLSGSIPTHRYHGKQMPRGYRGRHARVTERSQMYFLPADQSRMKWSEEWDGAGQRQRQRQRQVLGATSEHMESEQHVDSRTFKFIIPQP